MRFFIEIAYLGKHFHGWQKQPNATSVQEEIEKALSMVGKQTISIMGSSRTDAGVHARQQFAHFDCSTPLPDLKNLVYRLNKILPDSISILTIFEVTNEMHTRFDATARKYIYRISPLKNPFVKDISLNFNYALDIEKLNKIEPILKNHTDFQCFSKVKTEVNNYNCTIEEAFWLKNGDIYEFHVKANRFLRGMVRAMVGTALDLNKDKITLEDYREILASKNRSNAGSAAPAHGLTLEQVVYPPTYFTHEN